MTPRARVYVRFLVVLVVLGGVGLAATLYLLVRERATLPFEDVYTLKAEFSSTNGVVGGLGQPVNVVGVKVGQVIGAKLVDGRALVTLQIQRHQLPHVYANASAELEPITPLHDMQVNLDPGRSPAATLPPGATLEVRQTNTPVPLSDLLSTLDRDTRAFLSSLIASVAQGTNGRAADLRRVLAAMGPTVADAGTLSHALARRRAALAEFVHNLARVTRAAARDHQLAAVVQSGDRTLAALAAQDAPLREAIAKLPPTLSVARSTLVDLRPFALKLRPTLTALMPAVRRVPAMLSSLGPLADEGKVALAHEIRPLVREAQPVVRDLGPTVTALTSATPHLSRGFEVLAYLVNELAYNPGGKNQGFLFWGTWALHNFNSVISLSDAHGGIGRAEALLNCYGAQAIKPFQQAFGVLGLCQK
jgi:phospholipid/cholesterol/gamma-HCH transport system substrate-binding protein